jgi:hypothetical protein
MFAIQRSNKTAILWVITAVVAVGLLVSSFVPGVRTAVIVVQVGFEFAVRVTRAYMRTWLVVGPLNIIVQPP